MRRLALVSPAAALTLGAALLLGAAGCAGDPPSRPASGAGTVILQTRAGGGLMSMAEQLAPPEFTMYGDGRAIVAEDGDGPLPRLTEYRATPEQIRAVFAEAAGAGLFESRTHRPVREITDGGVLRIVIRSERGVHTTEVEAPTGDEDGARGAAIAFADGLRSAIESDDPARRPRPYRADRLGIDIGREPDPPAAVRDWTSAPITSRASRGCVTLRGAEADGVARAVAAAPRDTVWREGRSTFYAWIRPLLPHEADCRAAKVRS